LNEPGGSASLKAQATPKSGLYRRKPVSGFGRGRFGFGFGRLLFPLEITLTSFLFDRFVVLLAHSSLQSFGISILWVTL